MLSIVSRLILRALASHLSRRCSENWVIPSNRCVMRLSCRDPGIPTLFVVCEDYLLQPLIFAGLALQLFTLRYKSSVDDGANFVNCAACCKLHGLKVIYMLAVDYLP